MQKVIWVSSCLPNVAFNAVGSLRVIRALKHVPAEQAERFGFRIWLVLCLVTIHLANGKGRIIGGLIVEQDINSHGLAIGAVIGPPPDFLFVLGRSLCKSRGAEIDDDSYRQSDCWYGQFHRAEILCRKTGGILVLVPGKFALPVRTGTHFTGSAPLIGHSGVHL